MTRSLPIATLLLVTATLFSPRLAAGQTAGSPATQPPFPTATERLSGLAGDIAGPLALVSITGGAAYSHLLDSPREWNGGRGFGRRLASSFGQTVAAETASYALAELAKEDTRFQLSRKHGFLPRLLDAAAGSVTARRRDGRRVVSVARIGGHVASGTTRLLWYPSKYHTSDGFTYAASSAASSALVNIVREFIIRK